MKKLLVIFAAATVFSGCGTSFVDIVPHEKIIEAKGKSQNDLYVLANSWLVENFVSAEAVIEFQDRDAGKVIGKCVLRYATATSALKPLAYFGDARAIISIDYRDGAARIMFKFIRLIDKPSKQSERGVDRRVADAIQSRFVTLSADFAKYINQDMNW
jgi:hypothetical protein